MSVVPKVLIDNVQAPNSTGTALYTANNVTAQIDQATLTNVTGSAVTVDLYLIKQGESAVNNTKVVDGKSISANSTEILAEVIGHKLEPGGKIEIVASSASAITPYFSGQEIS